MSKTGWDIKKNKLSQLTIGGHVFGDLNPRGFMSEPDFFNASSSFFDKANELFTDKGIFIHSFPSFMQNADADFISATSGFLTKFNNYFLDPRGKETFTQSASNYTEELMQQIIILKHQIGELKQQVNHNEIPVEPASLTVTANGFIEERWNSVENIPSRLLEVGSTHVKLECVIDVATKEIENRTFPKELLEGIVPFKQGYPVLMKIFTRPGEVRFKFLDGERLVDEQLFVKEYFKGLSGDKLTKRLQ